MLVWKHFWISISAFIPYKHGEHIYQLFLHSATHLPWRSTLWFNYSLQKLSSSCLHFFAIIFNRKFMHGQLAPRTCTALMGGLSLCHHTARYVCIWLCQCRDWRLVQKKKKKPTNGSPPSNKVIQKFSYAHSELVNHWTITGLSQAGWSNKPFSSAKVAPGVIFFTCWWSHTGLCQLIENLKHSPWTWKRQPLSLPALDFVPGLLSAVCPSTG